MSTHEIIAAYNFLYTTLSGDATLATLAPGGVWRGVAPVNTTTPFVVFALQSGGNDTITMNAVRVLSNPLLQVKCVGPASITTQLGQVSARVDTLLGRASGSVTGGLIASCYREQPFALDEVVNGVLTSSIGGLYRLVQQQQ